MDNKPTYSVDDILLEYELNKSSDKPSKKMSTSPKGAVDTFRAPMEPISVQPPCSAVDTFVKKAPSTSPKETLRAVKPIKKAEEDTRPIPPIKSVVTEKVPEKTVAVSTRTRVLTVAQSEEKYHTQELPVPDQLDGQMVMENFVEEPIDEERLERELRQRRQQKIDGFRLIEGGKSAFKLTGEEEEADPEEELVHEEEQEELLEDFNDYAEAEAISSELAYRRRMGAFGVIATAIMEALLLLLTLAYQAGWLLNVWAAVLIALHTALLVGMLCVNNRMVAGGIKALFHLRANADTPPAVAGVFGLIYTAAQFTSPDAVTAGSAMFLSAAAGIGVLAGALGRQVQIVRVSRNFRFVGGDKNKKLAACFIDDEKTAAEIGQPAGIDGIPPVVYYRKASFLTRFLECSYGHDPADSIMRWFVPLSLGVALLCAIGYGLLFPGYAWKAPTVFVSSVLLTSPVWSMFTTQRALSRSCKRALKKGVMIGGFEATQRFGHHPKAVILEAQELFPKKQVKLHGIKTFSGTRIDEAITDAAAVVIAAGGPLTPIFNRLIENRTDILREVDSLAYEQDMGLSGWVGGRRVLIGNRRLLENHGVEVPTKDYEARYTKDGRNTVYLSTGGELSAMFVVSYLAHDMIKSQLHALYKEHITPIVRTCDPNITPQLICEVMKLPPRSVEVLSASEGRAYETLITDVENDRAAASLACGGHAVSKMFALTQCARLRRAASAGMIAQIILGIAAMAFVAFISATTGLVFRSEVLVGLIALGGVVGWLVPKLLRA